MRLLLKKVCAVDRLVSLFLDLTRMNLVDVSRRFYNSTQQSALEKNKKMLWNVFTCFFHHPSFFFSKKITPFYIYSLPCPRFSLVFFFCNGFSFSLFQFPRFFFFLFDEMFFVAAFTRYIQKNNFDEKKKKNLYKANINPLFCPEAFQKKKKKKMKEKIVSFEKLCSYQCKTTFLHQQQHTNPGISSLKKKFHSFKKKFISFLFSVFSV
jgi:hypothetical protein